MVNPWISERWEGRWRQGADGKKSSVPKKEYSKNRLPGRKEAEVKLGS